MTIASGWPLLLLFAFLFLGYCDQTSSIINIAQQNSFDVVLSMLGHNCYSFRLNSNGYFWWITGDGSNCLVNVDRANITLTGIPEITCALEINNVFQRNAGTQKDIWSAVTSVVNLENKQICVSTKTTALGNEQPVESAATCPPCQGNSPPEKPFQAGSFINAAMNDISVSLFTTGASSPCYQDTIYKLAKWSFTAPPGYCPTPVVKILFRTPIDNCELNLSSALSNAVSGVVGMNGATICLNPIVASSLDQVAVSSTCPPCK